MAHQPSKRKLPADGIKNNSSIKKTRPNDTYQSQGDQTSCQNRVRERIEIAGKMHMRVKRKSVRLSGSSSKSRRKTTAETTPKNHNQTTSTVNSVGKSVVSDGDVTDAPDDPQTPIETTGSHALQTTPPSIKSSTGSIPHVDSSGKSRRLQLFEAELGVKMDLWLGYGDYVVSIQKRSIISNSTYENRKEDANQLPQNPGMQFLPSEMLSNMIAKAGEQMFAQYLEWLQNHHMLGTSSVPRIDYSDQ